MIYSIAGECEGQFLNRPTKKVVEQSWGVSQYIETVDQESSERNKY